MRTSQAIVVGLIIGFLAGVGTMQASLIGDVRDHSTRINHIERDVSVQTDAMEKRFTHVVQLLDEMLQTNRELIVLLNNKIKP